MKVRTVIIVLCLVLVSSVIMLDVDAGGSRVTPSAPNSVAAEPNNNMIRITWDFPTGYTGDDLLGFTVKRGRDSGSVNSIVANLGPYVISFPDVALTNGITYFYTVSAINDEGSGTPSDPVSAISRGPSSKPKNFTATYGSNYIHLTWESPADPNGSPVSGYSVFKGYKENNISIRNDVEMDLEFIDSGLINGKTYYYQVLAITDHGDGTKSEKMILSPKTTPSAPFNITLRSGDEKVHITWNHFSLRVVMLESMSRRKQRDLAEKERMELLDMGDLMFQRKKYLKALKYYDDVIQLDPRYKTGYLKKGDSLREMKRLREALFVYNKAIEIDPDFALAIENKGMVLMMMKKYDRAIECFVRSLSSNPHNKETWYMNGLAKLRTGHPAEAIDSFDHALHLDPHYKIAWKSKGDALMENDELNEALLVLKKALDLDPDYMKCKESLKILRERIVDLRNSKDTDIIPDIEDYEEYEDPTEEEFEELEEV